ncbi:protein Wnt-16-like [Stegodyphus dumicola]|uniref:protein Wnt-16-like n=1 Tax=Stegodyphus dumicola TaxID=202533 RepID=UPI0015AB0641|nr:protein Wnt-16-like [Stegodyphus dumicola]
MDIWYKSPVIYQELVASQVVIEPLSYEATFVLAGVPSIDFETEDKNGSKTNSKVGLAFVLFEGHSEVCYFKHRIRNESTVFKQNLCVFVLPSYGSRIMEQHPQGWLTDGASCPTAVLRVNSVSTQTLKSDSNGTTSRKMGDVIRFLWAKNVAASEIHRQIVEVYGDKAMSRQQVAKWCRSYQAGREHVENRNMEESGRPSSSRTDINTTRAEEIVQSSRETAFIYAITSAGATHAVTQACSAGNLTDCSCDTSRQGQSTPEGWKWGGCSDNVRYGMMFARQFVDAPERAERKRDVRAMMNLHNNNAGRLAIARQMEQKCRCHGVSGSCELKTCWNKLPSFEQVGHFLKTKYDNSIQVSAKAKRRLRRRGKVKRKVPVQKEDLVHIHRSPNFCVEDPKRGILGTGGRRCNRTASGPQSCTLLCCGRGYNTQVIEKLERCQCKFHWCCIVRCKTCEIKEEIYTCK